MSTTTTALSSAGTKTEASAGAADSFAALFEASISAGDFGKEGEIVKGTVVAVQRDNVVIDIGGKSEGIIALHEFADAAGPDHGQGGRRQSTSTSRAARTTTASSRFPRRKPTR